ncbi:MAG: 2-oxoacid:acceptor oxidoreductase subunit alpha [Candidatus Levybacteria bacterium]|nr:2-oxoacid:acceptor oxidoreductase subunit alpha [Candidatus Levybacteria bacterium]
MVDLQWLIGGEAGYGIMTVGLMMSKIFTRLGLHVFDYVEYPSLIRGGHNAYYVRGSDVEMTSQKRPVDILVALNLETITLHKTELSPNAVVIFDPNIVQVKAEDFSPTVKLYPVPFLELTKKLGADRLMINTVAVGASLALFSSDFSILEKIMNDIFGRKGEQVVGENVNTSKAGFDHVVGQYGKTLVANIAKTEQKNLLIGGAEAIALGSIKAGLKFAAIYPMTPINGVMTTLVANALTYNIVVKEPEDEIAGINMALGAAYAGVRSMAATSGGGFSLMVEGLGLAAQTEVPIVIIMGMRPGPATGMPTWTEQGDLRFVLHAHQGDFPRIIVAPGDPTEAFYHTMHAFNLAEKYHLPVIVLVDKYLNEGHVTVESKILREMSDTFVLQRGKLLTDAEVAAQTDYKRYLLTTDGISPRSLPGQKGGISLTGSDEHDERGLYNEEAEVRQAMMDKRFKKMETALSDFPKPELYSSESENLATLQQAPLTLVSFGSTKMPILEAMRWLKRDGIHVNFVKVSYLNPFPTEPLAILLKQAKKTLIIENNHEGQFEGLIRERTGLVMNEHLRKYDGRPFYPEEIVDHVKALLAKS